MSGRGAYKRNRRGEGRRPPKDDPDSGQQQPKVEVDESSPIIQAFLQYRTLLDTRHDKHERIVKLGRDVTIESKRIIFTLHRITGGNREQTLSEAETKLAELDQQKWRPLAEELRGEEPHQFLRAYSPGLQEYIEAVTFLHYVQHKQLVPLTTLQQRLTFIQTKADVSESENQDPSNKQNQSSESNRAEKTEKDTSPPDAMDIGSPVDKDGSHVVAMETEPAGPLVVHIPDLEYMLGVADLTGEIMRQSINSVGAGDLDRPFENATFLRTIYDAFVSYGNVSKELNRKLFTLRQSLQKVEAACYALKVRGSEIPQHRLKDVFSAAGGGYEEETVN